MKNPLARLSGIAVAASFIIGSSAIGAPVVVPANSAGTVDIPVAGHPLTNASRLRRVASQPLPGVTQFELDMVSLTLSGPPSTAAGGSYPGGERHTSAGTAVVVLETPEGVREERSCPVQVVVDTPPRTPGPEQQFACRMVRLEGQLPPGDPDFDLLRITGGSDFSMTSEGQTTLSSQPGGSFAVESFFDITYQIEFSGAAGGSMAGSSGASTHTDRCEQPLHVLDGVLFEKTGPGSTVLTPDGLVCRGGPGGRTHITFGWLLWTDPDVRSARVFYQPSTGGLHLPGDGDQAILGVTYRGIEKSQIKRMTADCRNTGGQCTVTANASELGTGTCRVELRHQGRLLDSADAPVTGTAFSCPAAAFHVLSHQAGLIRGDEECDDGNDRFEPSMSLHFDPNSPVPVTISSGTFMASEVRLVPVDPTAAVNGVRDIDNDCSGDCVIRNVSVRSFGHEVQGIGAGLLGSGGTAGSHWERRLPVHNLGSSGEDGITVTLQATKRPPLHVALDPREIEVTAGSTASAITLRYRDALGNPQGTCRIGGSGLGSGKVVFSDLSFISATTARVRVLSGNSLVGEADVALSGDTQVAALDDGTTGTARLTGCGTQEGAPPWQLPCFSMDFDRSLSVTPTGSSTPLVGDRLEVLAVNSAAGLPPMARFDLLACGPKPLVVCGVSSDPAPLAAPRVGGFSAGSEPFLPPAAALIDRYPKRIFDTSPATMPAGTEGLDIAIEISNIVDTGVPGPLNSRRCTCDVGFYVSGRGARKGYQYYMAKTDLSSCFIATGSNPFSGDDVQQVEMQLVSLDCSITGDPDFDLLRVRAGSAAGLAPSPGISTLTRTSPGNWRVDAFFDITYQIDFHGASGGPLDGCTGDQTSTARAQLHQPNTIRWGLVHTRQGQCDVGLSTTGGVSVSNIGSSGEDGVSIDLLNSEGGSVHWKPHTMAPGATLQLDAYGSIGSPPTRGWLGETTLTCGSSPTGPFYDVDYDLTTTGVTESIVQILDNGVVVSEVQVPATAGTCRVEPLAGTSLPQLRRCGVQPVTRGLTGRVLFFGGRCVITPPGSPPVEGDQVVVLTPRLHVGAVRYLVCRFANDGDWEIGQSSLIAHGRSIWGLGGNLPFSTHGTTHTSSRGGRIVLSHPDPISWNGAVVSPRDSSSGQATGKRSHKPVTVSLSGGDLSALGCALRTGFSGTVSGVPNTPACGMEIAHATGGRLQLTSSQGPYQFTAVIHTNPLYKEKGNTANNPFYEGRFSGTNPLLIDGAAPVIVSACGASPGDAGGPPQLHCTFASPVTFLTPDGGSVRGRQLTIIPDLPPGTVIEDLQEFSIQSTGIRSLAIEAVTTGPTPKDGLAHSSIGSCDLDTNSSGHLVVSNIGSSGQDGVEVALHRAEGVAMELTGPGATLPPGGELRFGTRPISELDPDGYPDVVVSSAVAGGGGSGGALYLRVERDPQPRRIHCWDGSCKLVGEFVLPPDDIGRCSPTGSSFELSVIGYNPQEVTSTGVVKPGPFITFKEPVLFQPSSGGAPVTCRTITIACTDSNSSAARYREEPYVFACRAASTRDLQFVDCSCSHLRSTPHRGDGGALLMADTLPDRVIVSNIGSSGQDGVSITAGGSCGDDKLTENVALSLSKIQLTPNDPATPPTNPAHLSLETIGTLNGVPLQSLGTCQLELQSLGGDLKIHADLSALSSADAQVVVYNGGVVAGTFTTPAGGAAVASVSDAGGTGISLKGCGHRLENVTANSRRGGHYFRFDTPVAVSAPGSSSVFQGNEIHILPASTTATTNGIRSFVLHAGGIPQLTINGRGRKDMLQWLTDHFSETEINSMSAADFSGDLDGDGTPDIEEFVRGTDVRTPESGDARRSPSGLIATGIDGLPHFRFRHVLADIEDVTSRVEASDNLGSWDGSPTRFRLLEVNSLPGGASEYVWEDVNPVSSDSTGVFYRGHITVLK